MTSTQAEKGARKKNLAGTENGKSVFSFAEKAAEKGGYYFSPTSLLFEKGREGERESE